MSKLLQRGCLGWFSPITGISYPSFVLKRNQSVHSDLTHVDTPKSATRIYILDDNIYVTRAVTLSTSELDTISKNNLRDCLENNSCMGDKLSYSLYSLVLSDWLIRAMARFSVAFDCDHSSEVPQDAYGFYFPCSSVYASRVEKWQFALVPKVILWEMTVCNCSEPSLGILGSQLLSYVPLYR